MAEVCGVGLKNLRANFRVEELFFKSVYSIYIVQKNKEHTIEKLKTCIKKKFLHMR